jgi:hypothetical protein
VFHSTTVVFTTKSGKDQAVRSSAYQKISLKSLELFSKKKKKYNKKYHRCSSMQRDPKEV